MTELVIGSGGPLDGQEERSYMQLASEAGFVINAGLLQCKKEWLQGIPHIITAVTFWTPTMGIGFCSIEATVAGRDILTRKLRRNQIECITEEGEPYVEPDERVVYSDGGTGIRRQLVELLHTVKLIDVGKHKGKKERGGKLGESIYDLPWTEWASFSQTGEQGEIAVPRFTELPSGGPLRIQVPTGLRKSEYDKGLDEKSATYYLG